MRDEPAGPIRLSEGARAKARSPMTADDRMQPRALRNHTPDPGCTITEAVHLMALERPISRRETEVLVLLANGRGRKEIAAALGISPSTVDVFASRLRRKVGVSSNRELIYSVLVRAAGASPVLRDVRATAGAPYFEASPNGSAGPRR